MVTLLRIIKYAFQNIARNSWLTIITVTILVLALFSVNLVIAVNVLADKAVKILEEKIDVRLHLKTDATENDVKSLRSYLMDQPEVFSVELISSEEAYTEFREKYKNDERIIAALDEIGENPLGQVMIIRARQSKDYNTILSALEHPAYAPLIQEKNFENYQILIERLRAITDRIQYFGIVLSSIFGVIALLIVINTVRVTIYVRREEIGIMRLVGAGSWFVRGPYLFESLILVVIAIVITGGLVFGILHFSEPHINSLLGNEKAGLFSHFVSNAHLIFGAEFIASAVLTLLASGFAVGRYLRV